MAIHPLNEAPQSPESTPASQPIDIQAWTEEATAAMGAVTINTAGGVQETCVSLAIPLDDVAPAAAVRPMATANTTKEDTSYYKRKQPLRRDSLKRREALLKGKEGSRRRQRWENDRLLSNPHAEPPTPRDWEIHPTHPTRHIPYYLAPLWDAGLSTRSTDRQTAAVKAKSQTRSTAKKPTDPGIVPKELRDKLKRSRGAKGLLMDLEEDVRRWVSAYADKERSAEADGLPLDPDSSDDEIVFVGRNGAMNDLRSPSSSSNVKRELMLFETLEADQGGSFGRWLVHHIGVYYGLRTWSVTVGDPARREAYIGVKDAKMRSGVGRPKICNPMPRPLYGLV
ncbi:hypothetical protein CC78DRAFT_536201 [Lojkania enalia]|uniref:R3H-associated N-terminal domain-containing protein n=1 Tax=Lojkania enalia TaxID=147567 RepID=A0A9P4K3P3_9PLEO|nr:hypothetical protein CC78DRAFT_536201 [Didymosphaeria enalia]